MKSLGGVMAEQIYIEFCEMTGLAYFHSGLIRIVSPKGAVVRESVTQSTGYSGTSGYELQHKSVR